MRALLITLLFASALGAASCTESGSGRGQTLLVANSQGAEPSVILERLAQQEADARDIEPLDVPPPPGVQASALSPARGDDHHATWSYGQVMRALADAHAQQAADVERPHWLDEPAWDPEQAERHYVRGRDAVARDKYDEAMRELLLAHNFDAHSATVTRELARVYDLVRNQAAAAEMYEHLLLLEPGDPEAVLALALNAADRRRFGEAAGILAHFWENGGTFDFDPAAEALARACLVGALDELGYDRAVSYAGEQALSLLATPPHSDRFSREFGQVYRQRGELLQRIGDARSRLGQFHEALAAYEASAALPAADAWVLLPRRVYALLRIGRIYGAQHLVHVHLAGDVPGDVDVRDVSLCTYLAEHVQQDELLAESVLALHLAHPDKPALVRCAAALVERGRAIELLRAFVMQREGDAGVLQQFLDWLAQQDLDAAADLVCTIAERHPQRMDRYAGALLHAARDPTPLLAALERGPHTAMRNCILAIVNERLGALGRAWTVVQRAADDFPDSPHVARLSIRLAAALMEPALLTEALAQAEHLDDAVTWAARVDAHRSMGDLRQAHAAASEAIAVEPDNIEALLQLARTQAAIAVAQPTQEQARLHAWDAAQTAEHVLSLQPNEERAYEILFFIFGSEGPLTNAESVEEYTAELASANPGSSLLARLSLEAAVRQLRYDRAVELALELYKQSPAESGTLSYAISAWSAQDDLDAANAWLAESRLDRPQDPVLLEAWARVKMMRSESRQAQQELTQLLEVSPRNFRAMELLEAVYRATGDLDRAIELGEARLLTRPAGVQRELALASMLAEAGRDERAVERLRWIAEHPSDASLEQLTAAIRLVGGIEAPAGMRDTFARTLIDRIVLDHPEVSLGTYLSGLQVLQGLEQRDDDRLDALLSCLEQRAGMDASAADRAAMFWREIAQQLVNLGRVDGASDVLRARLDSAEGLDAPSATLLILCTVIADAAGGAPAEETARLLEQTFEGGELDLRSVLRTDLTLADLLFEAGNAYSLMGNEAGAELLLRRCIERDPRHAMAMNNLGYQLIEQGSSDAATAAIIERAIELLPNDPNVLDTIGWLRYKHGQFEDEVLKPAEAADDGEGVPGLAQRGMMRPGAESLIRESIQRAPTPSAEVRDHLGDVLWRLGRADDALREWQSAHELLSDDARKRALLNQYALVQRNVWNLEVLEPEAIWEREYGGMRDRVMRKINAAEAGTDPEVAPTFEELSTQEDR